MKASEIKKESISIESIYGWIKSAISNKEFKIFVPHYVFMSDDVKLKLIEDEFKVHKGEWLRGDKGLIIEW